MTDQYQDVAGCLDAVIGHVRRYIIITDHQAVAIALWVVHCHALDACDQTPYLAITSPEPRCGKSHLLELLEGLVPRPWSAIRPSEPVTFRKIAKDCPTFLLDEVDTIWTNAQEHEGLRALLNAGNRRGVSVPRCHGPALEIREFPVFCPKALGGIGGLPRTVADRAIDIRLKKKKKDERVERFRQRTVKADGEPVRDMILLAVPAAVVDVLADARPALPDELDDRAQDGWEPLLAIADMAGGEWPTRGRAAAVALSAGRDEEETGIEHRLLMDCQIVFDETRASALKTATLIDALGRIPDAPWDDYKGKPVTGRRVAYWLKKYGIRPHRDEGASAYHRGDFLDAWARYGSQSARSANDESRSGIAPDSEVRADAPASHFENPGLPRNHAGYRTSRSSEPDIGRRDAFERLAEVLNADTQTPVEARIHVYEDAENLSTDELRRLAQEWAPPTVPIVIPGQLDLDDARQSE